MPVFQSVRLLGPLNLIDHRHARLALLAGPAALLLLAGVLLLHLGLDLRRWGRERRVGSVCYRLKAGDHICSEQSDEYGTHLGNLARRHDVFQRQPGLASTEVVDSAVRLKGRECHRRTETIQRFPEVVAVAVARRERCKPEALRRSLNAVLRADVRRAI